ncbi:MAG: PGF-CTERM sorting domain-containing protein, partial [Euryarchaeota archaeon]|nr:PGF-CTERM sorting domain-containing protein [Euryarchaeota archaeon]
VNGTKPIGAAAEKIRVEAEKVEEAEKQAAVKALESGVASAEPAETIDTPVRKEPGFTGAIAVITLLAAILLAGRHRRSRR